MATTTQNNVCPFRKGDRVEITDNHGKTRPGIVRATHLVRDRMSMDTDDNRVITAHFSMFRPCSLPAPARATNPFRIGDRIEWDTKDGIKTGTITKVREYGITVGHYEVV